MSTERKQKILLDTFPYFKVPKNLRLIPPSEKPRELLTMFSLPVERGPTTASRAEFLIAPEVQTETLKLKGEEVFGAIAKLEVKRETPTQHVLANIESETRNRIKENVGNLLVENNFSKSRFFKIKETLIDLIWLARLYKIEMNDFYDFLTIIRLLNEAVYWMDDWVEGKKSKRDAYLKRAIMHSLVDSLLCEIRREDLILKIPKILTDVDKLYANEILSQLTNSDFDKIIESAGSVYKTILKPSNMQYMDTGAYGTLFSYYFKKKVENSRTEKLKFQDIWNNSRRVTDIIDGLIDLEDDVKRGVFCPLTIYLYYLGNIDDKKTIKRSIFSGNYYPKMERIAQKYSSQLLQSFRDYVMSIPVVSINMQALRDRTLKIIDLGTDIAKDFCKIKNYKEFYDHSLD